MLRSAEFIDWKRFNEGRRRGIIGPFRSTHGIDGADCLICFYDDSVLVARMRVCDSNTEKLSIECERVFEIDDALIFATQHIYVPTQEEWEQWNDEDQGLPGQDPMDRCRALDGTPRS